MYATTNEAKSVLCKMCDNTRDHTLTGCPKVKAMSLDERWDRLAEKKVCVGCQLPLAEVKHPYKKCEVKCTVSGCSMSHHPLFHRERANRGEGWTSNNRGRGSGRGYRGRGGYQNRGQRAPQVNATRGANSYQDDPAKETVPASE